VKKFFHISHSHKEAAEFYEKRDFEKTPDERVKHMEYLRKRQLILKGMAENSGIAEHIKVIKKA